MILISIPVVSQKWGNCRDNYRIFLLLFFYIFAHFLSFPSVQYFRAVTVFHHNAVLEISYLLFSEKIGSFPSSSFSPANQLLNFNFKKRPLLLPCRPYIHECIRVHYMYIHVCVYIYKSKIWEMCF